MEPKYITLLQAAAIAAILAIVVVTYEPPTEEGPKPPSFAIAR